MEFRLITPKSIIGTYFYTKLSRLGLAGLTMVVNLDFQMTISQLFQDLHSSNLKFKLINPQPITRTYMDTNLRRLGLAGLPMAAILNFLMSIYQPSEELQD